MLSVQSLQPQGDIASATTQPQPTLNIVQPKQQALSYVGTADNPTQDVAPLPEDVKQKMIAKLTEAQQKYPGQEANILHALVRDNKDQYPAQMGKIQQYLGTQATNSRADRNNNVIAAAMSSNSKGNEYTDALDAAGVPWTQGDKFSDNPNMATIKIQGDGIEGARAILSNSTAIQRWYINHTGKNVLPKYGVFSNTDFQKLDKTTQDQIIKEIGSNEGSTTPQSKYNPSDVLSALVRDNAPSNNQTNTTEQLPTVGEELKPRLELKKLGSELSARGSQISSTFKDSNAGYFSKALQTVGAIAGGVGDVVNTGLGLVPGVKLAQDEIGLGVKALAKTEAGQSVLKHLNQFGQEHPELAKNAGATFNIVTAIPILKGLAAVKNVVLDATSQALKSAAEKAAVTDLTEVASRTIAGREALSTVPQGLDTLVKERAIPDIITEGGISRYSTENAGKIVNNTISTIDKTELQPILEEIGTKQNFGQNLGSLKKLAIQAAENDPILKEAGMVPQAISQIEKRFAGWKYSYGNNVDLATVNRLKIGSGKFVEWGTPEGSGDKAIYKALQQNVEDVAKKNGFEDLISQTNGKMKNLITSKELLDAIDGKVVKNTGILHAGLKNAATGAGEIMGNSFGLPPLAGGFIGRGVGGVLDNTVGKLAKRNLVKGILERTAPDFTRDSVKPAIVKGVKNAVVNRVPSLILNNSDK